MSTAEKIFQKAKNLPEQAQITLLQLAEVLAAKENTSAPSPKPRFGSAKGMIKVGPEFDDPLEDFKSYRD